MLSSLRLISSARNNFAFQTLQLPFGMFNLAGHGIWFGTHARAKFSLSSAECDRIDGKGRWLWRVKASQGRRQSEISSSQQRSAAAEHSYIRKSALYSCNSCICDEASLYDVGNQEDLCHLLHNIRAHLEARGGGREGHQLCRWN